jgi:hypothetical protein
MNEDDAIEDMNEVVATREHYERMVIFREIIGAAVAAGHSLLGFRDGDSSLMVTALIDLAGELTSGCPQPARGRFVEWIQDYYMRRANRVDPTPKSEGPTQ